ncbi:MAG: HD domain-containing protein [Candidatus Eisenbacteria bacterium]|nr:HD domain-containing protein [Candidatus Eisenbacteria bacterium]
MTERHDGTNASSAPDGLAARVMAIAPLPRLSHEEHRAASECIQSLVAEVQHDTGPPLGFETLCALAAHLRAVGDPSAAETIALHSHRVFLEDGRPISAVTMLNAAGLACFDQGAFQDAERLFCQALELIPASDPLSQTPVILLNRAAVLTETGQYGEALKIYGEIMNLVQKRPRAVFAEMDSFLPQEVRGLLTNNAGWVLLRMARATGNDKPVLQRATAAIEEALSLPLHARTRVIALGNRAEVCVRLGDHRKAERILAPLETECMRAGQEQLLPEIYRRWAQVYASRGETAAAVQWARKAMQSSLLVANPRQELRIVEVFVDILRDLVSKAPDPHHALESTGEPVVMQVLELLQSKDTYTGGDHSLRVSALAGRIAVRVLGNGEPRVRRVKRVELDGLFHDFGKLLVPWCILNKVSPLSDRDWSILRSHTTRGEELLDGLGLRTLARVAGGHHERPDGTGYPRGLKQTTKEESIVAVADAFEAMTSPSRLYSRPKTISEGLAEVQRGSGTQFQPMVVEALDEVFRARA